MLPLGEVQPKMTRQKESHSGHGDFEKKGREIVQSLLAEEFGWSEDDVLHSQFVAGGITNILICVENLTSSEKVLVRFFGPRTEVIVNRERGNLIDRCLSRLGITKKVYARFPGGQIEEWFSGKSLEPSEMSKPFYQKSIASSLAKLHSVKISDEIYRNVEEEYQKVFKPPSSLLVSIPSYISPLLSSVGSDQAHERSTVLDHKNQPSPISKIESNSVYYTSSLWPSMYAWIEKCFAVSNENQFDQKVQSLKFLDMNKIKQKLDHLYIECLKMSERKSFGWDTVFGHNDLLSGNILDQQGIIKFIDFEYSGPSERAFDIANHFCECCGFECDWSRFPNLDSKRIFIEAYLNELELDFSCTKEDIIVELLNSIEFFVKVSHLFWGIWALTQSLVSEINFDFLTYSIKRLRAAFDQTGCVP